MGKTAIDAKRGNVFMMEPDKLTMVTDVNHPLYDARVHDAPDESMVRNIIKFGVMEPIIVRKNGEAIEVVDGRGRVNATLEANRRLVEAGGVPILVPAVVRKDDTADLIGVMISANEQRREDTMVNRGKKARQLQKYGHDNEFIADFFKVTRQAVDNWLAVDELAEPIKDAIECGEIKATAALQLSGLSHEEQVSRFEDLKRQGVKLTVRNVKNAAEYKPPVKNMRTRKEVKAMIYDRMPAMHDYNKGYIDALRWVLGEDENNEVD